MKITAFLGFLFLAGCGALPQQDSPAMKWLRLRDQIIELQNKARPLDAAALVIANEEDAKCQKNKPPQKWGFNGVVGPMCITETAPLAPPAAK